MKWCNDRCCSSDCDQARVACRYPARERHAIERSAIRSACALSLERVIPERGSPHDTLLNRPKLPPLLPARAVKEERTTDGKGEFVVAARMVSIAVMRGDHAGEGDVEWEAADADAAREASSVGPAGRRPTSARYMSPTISYLAKAGEDVTAVDAQERGADGGSGGGERAINVGPDAPAADYRPARRKSEAVRHLKDRGRERANVSRARSRPSSARLREIPKPTPNGNHGAPLRRAKAAAGAGGGDAASSRGGGTQRLASRARADRDPLWDTPISTEELYTTLTADIRKAFDKALASEDADARDAAAARRDAAPDTEEGAPSTRPEAPDPASDGLATRAGVTHEDRLAREQETLRRRALALERELKEVEASRRQLQRAEERKARQRKAKESLACYERELSSKLEARTRTLMEERDGKVRDINRFRTFITDKVRALQDIMAGLVTKEESLMGAYDAAVQQLHREYAFLLNKKGEEVTAALEQSQEREAAQDGAHREGRTGA